MSHQVLRFDKHKCSELLLGAAGIYITYLLIGVIQEWLIKLPYTNDISGKEEKFNSIIHFIFFPHGTAYIIGYIFSLITVPKSQKTVIPAKNSILCASVILIGGLTFNLAILWTSYPIVITAKSCNLLSVILVGTLCSRVADKKLKLSQQKIIIGIIVSIGILLFKFFDPQSKIGEEKKLEGIGLAVLLISLLADGFLPDFQAEIKSKFNPKPIQMMTQINKWITIFSGVYILLNGQIYKPIQFALSHRLFGYHLIAYSILSTMGHFIIYRMIKVFKQHIVPFVITTRKVFTVLISLIFYHHQTSFGQIFGILIVLGVVVYEFVSQLYVTDQINKSKGQIISEQQCDIIKFGDNKASSDEGLKG